jgi:hypothetical protein
MNVLKPVARVFCLCAMTLMYGSIALKFKAKKGEGINRLVGISKGEGTTGASYLSRRWTVSTPQ